MTASPVYPKISSSVGKLHDIVRRNAGDNVAKALIPLLERVRLELDQIGLEIVPDQSARSGAALRAMTHYSANHVTRNPNLVHHRRRCPAQIVSSKRSNRRSDHASTEAQSQQQPTSTQRLNSDKNRGPSPTALKRASMIVRARPTSGVVAWMSVLRTRAGSSHNHLAQSISPVVMPTISPMRRAGRQLHAQSVRHCGRKIVEPWPEQADFIKVENTVARRSLIIDRQTARWISADNDPGFPPI